MNESLCVLIAEDSGDFAKACQKELKELGFQVATIKKDGRRVIEAVESTHFDAVIMDVFMSGLDGIEVLEHTKEVCPNHHCLWFYLALIVQILRLK